MISHITAIVASLAMIGSSMCLADQLQWNAFGVCVRAAHAVGRESLLVSYCSQANEDHVELWLVRELTVVDTPVEGLFEVLALAKCLYRSQDVFSSGEFPVSADHWSFNKVRDSGWLVEGIDLAYTYIHMGGSSFQCLGKVLDLQCLVGVETICLPDDVMEDITVGRTPRRCISLRSIEATNEPFPVLGR